MKLNYLVFLYVMSFISTYLHRLCLKYSRYAMLQFVFVNLFDPPFENNLKDLGDEEEYKGRLGKKAGTYLCL